MICEFCSTEYRPQDGECPVCEQRDLLELGLTASVDAKAAKTKARKKPEKPRQKNLGKALEAELADSFSALDSWSHNSNDSQPACDRCGCLGVRLPSGLIVGLSVLVEAKETRDKDGKFKFSAVRKRQYGILEAHWMGNGISVVIIKWVRPGKSRAFACLFEDWVELQVEHGYNPNLPEGQRNKPGSASFSLQDKFRPQTVVELTKFERPNSLGRVWDLSPIVPVGLELVGRA